MARTIDERYAEALLRTGNPFAAALACGFGPGEAHQVANTWPHKLDVLIAKNKLVEEFGEEYFLPDKTEACRKVLQVYDESRDPSDKLNAMKLYADMRGFIVQKVQGSGTLEVVVRGVRERALDAKALTDGKVIDISSTKRT